MQVSVELQKKQWEALKCRGGSKGGQPATEGISELAGCEVGESGGWRGRQVGSKQDDHNNC